MTMMLMDEIMALLDPPTGAPPLAVTSIAKAHELIVEHLCHSNNKNVNSTQRHPRVEAIREILLAADDHDSDDTTSSRNHPQQQQQQQQHMKEHLYYRAILVASYLRIELDKNLSLEQLKVLQSNMERSILLLQTLASWSCESTERSVSTHPTGTAWTKALPSVTPEYPLLQAVLDEPLVPLDRHERQFLYQQQLLQHLDDGNGGCCDDTDSTKVMNEHHSTNEYDDDNHEAGLILFMPSKRQLQKEEAALVKMSQTPIPEGAAAAETQSVDELAKEMLNDENNNNDDDMTNPYKRLIKEGSLQWRRGPPFYGDHDDSNNIDSLWMPCLVRVYACGAVVTAVEPPTASCCAETLDSSAITISSSSCCNREQQRHLASVHLLTHKSACHLDHESLRMNLTECVVLKRQQQQHCQKEEASYDSSNAVTISFRVESKEIGSEWEKALRTLISGSLRPMYSLQEQLREEYNKDDEYDRARNVVASSCLSSPLPPP